MMPDREKVIKDLDELYRLIYQSNVDGEILGSLHDAIALLKEQEAKEQISDAIHETAKQFRQAIVRCKDCKHGEPGACGDGVDCDGVWHNDDWFCADGEKKDESSNKT